jgi:acetyltransferase-like isoleucine patch superfamily enzyme
MGAADGAQEVTSRGDAAGIRTSLPLASSRPSLLTEGSRKVANHSISSRARVGKNVRFGDYVVVGDDVVLGDGVIVHPNVVIAPGVVIEENVEVFPGAFLGKEPKGAGATARIPTFNRTVRIGKNCSIGPNAVVFYDVEIGEGTLLGDGASIREQGRIGSKCIISRYVTLNYNARIGDRTKIMDLTHITGNCVVGNDVFVSIHVSTVNDNAIGAEGYDEARIVGPTLGDGCMIGANAVLLPNVKIGARAVVAAGAVVTTDVAPGEKVFGIPARSRARPL